MLRRIEELVEEIDRLQARVEEHRRQELVVQRRTWAEWARESEVYRPALQTHTSYPDPKPCVVCAALVSEAWV